MSATGAQAEVQIARRAALVRYFAAGAARTLRAHRANGNGKTLAKRWEEAWETIDGFCKPINERFTPLG
jgi:hypothetical protein